jgi:hypothetical protein
LILSEKATKRWRRRLSPHCSLPSKSNALQLLAPGVGHFQV